MDEKMMKFISTPDLGQLPKSEFDEWLSIIDDMPRKGVDLLKQYFEITNDNDVYGKMSNIIKTGAFVVGRKMLQEMGLESDNPMSDVICEVVLQSMIEGLIKAYSAGFAAGIAFNIEQMDK